MNIQDLTKKTKTRHLKRTNELVSSNFRMELDTLKAYSYSWWLFCTKVNDKVVFNNVRYSPSTDKHQSKAFKVLNYETDLTLRFTRKSLSDLPAALENEVELTKREISNLISKIRQPRTRKSTNEERKKQITYFIKHISNVRKTQNEVKGA